MQARLKVIQDNANLKQVKLLPVTMIGRSADCHLKIASSEVSRNHCRITVTHNEVFIEDLNSSNGTYVDQVRIPPSQQIPLSPGAKLHIGPAAFIVDFTPPVNLETMPTTVIKSSELPFLQELATPSAAPAITVAPAVANPSPETEPPADIPSVAAMQSPVEPEAEPIAETASTAEPALDPFQVEPVPIDVPEDEFLAAMMPAQGPPDILPPVPEVVAAAAPGTAPAMPMVDSPPPAPQPAVLPVATPVVEVKPLPPVAVPVAAAVVRTATPVAKAIAKPITAGVPPVAAKIAAPGFPPTAAITAAVPPAPPEEAASVVPPSQPEPAAAAFDFLGAAPPAAPPAAGRAMDPFNFGDAAPAMPVAMPVASSVAKPAAAKKSLFGFFGKKDKPATPAPPAAAPVLPIAIPAALPADENPFAFAAEPAASPVPAAVAIPPAVPVLPVTASTATVPPEPFPEPEVPVAAPPDGDDPFAFLKGS